MSLIRMLGCCCETGGPGGPGTGSRLCDVVAWCYDNEKTEPYLTSWSQTGTKPQTSGSSTRQETAWTSAVTGVTVVNKTYLGDGGGLKNRFAFDLEIDYTLTFIGTSGSTDCGCKRAGVWEVFDTTSGSATTTSRILVGCKVSGGAVDSIAVDATRILGGTTIAVCDAPFQTGSPVGIGVAGPQELFPGPNPATGMDTCVELRTKTMAYETTVSFEGTSNGCGDEAEDGNLHRVTFNLGYA